MEHFTLKHDLPVDDEEEMTEYVSEVFEGDIGDIKVERVVDGSVAQVYLFRWNEEAEAYTQVGEN